MSEHESQPPEGTWVSSSQPPDPVKKDSAAEPAGQPVSSPRRRSYAPLYAGLAIIAIAAGSGAGYLAWRDSGGRPAIRKCETAVRAELKSPSTASFSGEHAKDDGLWWDVTGSVDSQNSFGAVVRNTWSCQSDKDIGDGQPLQTVVTGGLDN